MQANGGDSALDHAARRLEAAMSLLEQRVSRRMADASAGAEGAIEADRARLAAELDAARAREKALEAAGAEAAQALDQAIAEIRAVLGAQASEESA